MKQNIQRLKIARNQSELWLWLLVTLASSTVYTQSRSFRATVYNEFQESIEIGNCFFYDLDSNLVHGELFYDGSIFIEQIPENAYRLELSALGYEPYSIVPIVGEAGSEPLSIVLQSLQLDAIEVVAARKMIEQNGSDITVNVANTLLGNAGSIMDVIRLSPKISLGRNGAVSVLGKGAAKIYLNGQEISSLEALKSLSSTEVQKLEILENPPAKYDAQGQAVINIVSVQKSIEGFKINALQEVGYGKFYRSYYEGRAFWKKGSVLVEGNYGYKPWGWGGRNNQQRRHLIEDDVLDIDSRFTYKHDRNDHTYGARVQLDLMKNGNLGFQWMGSNPTSDRTGVNNRIVQNNNTFDFSIASELAGPIDQTNNTYRAYFQSNIKANSRINFNLQYSNFDQERLELNQQNLSTLSSKDNFLRRTFNTNRIDVYTAQLDMSTELSAKRASLEYGLKSAYISNGSEVVFESANGSEAFKRVDDFSNVYDYTENILSAYAQMQLDREPWNIRLGARYEWTNNNGVSGFDETKETFKNTYGNLFPTVEISRKWSEKVSQTVQYSYRINRPTFQHLNPFIFFVDSLVSLNGNPRLRPEYANNISTNLALNNFNFNLNYTFTRDKINNIFRSSDPNDETVIAFAWENLRSTSLLSADISWPINIQKYTAHVTLGGFYDNHQVMDIDRLAINKKVGYYIQSNHSIALPAALNLSAQMNYTSSQVDGIYIDNPISFVNLSIARSFFDNHLTVRLWANDIFDRYKFTGNVDFSNLSANYLSEGDWHYFKISFNWDFGRLKPKANTTNISSEELSRINSGL